MELDNLKQTWQKVEPTNMLSTEQIKAMLNNSNNSALQRLISWEKMGVIFLPICAAMFILLVVLRYLLISQHKNNEPIMYLSLAYAGVCAIATVWQLYKLEFLKKINIGTSMTTLSKAMARYRNFLMYELVFSLVFILAFIPAWFYYSLGTNEPILVYVIIGAFFLCLLAGALWVCYLIYGSTIKQIRKNLKEAKEFGIE